MPQGSYPTDLSDQEGERIAFMREERGLLNLRDGFC